jgi:hypothetical protein
VTDLDVSWDVRPTTNIGIGANNLFDEHPDKIGIVNADTAWGSSATSRPSASPAATTTPA